MTIETRNIPSSSEILEYVPSSTYIKNQSTSNRRIQRIAPDTNNLKGSFVANTVASFTIPYSTNSLLNLSECYFNICGVIDAYKGTDLAATGSTIGKVKCGPLWLLPMIQKATLEVGGCAIYDKLQPFRLSKLKQMMYYDYNDMMNQTLSYQNIPPYDKTLNLITLPIYTGTMDNTGANFKANMDFINNTTIAILGFTALTDTFTATVSGAEYAGYCTHFNTNVITAFNTKYGTTITADTYTAAGGSATNPESVLLMNYFNAKIQEMNTALNTLTGVDLLCSTNIGKLPSFQLVHEKIDDTHTNDRIKFQQYLKLSDIFPIESLKPLFGQTVRIILNFESSAFIDVQVDKTANIDNLLVSSFDQFVLNSISYTINVDLQNKLNQIYSKPVLEIIDDITIWDGPLQRTVSGSSIPIRAPIDVLFECDFVGIGLAQSSSGSYQMKQAFSTLNANFTNHNLSDFRFFNIQKIEVTLDNEVVYYHDFADMKVKGTSGTVIPFISKSCAGSPLASTNVDIYNFVPLYELYKECRWSFGRDEKGCIPYNDFLTTGFIIPLPMSAFSRISTNSQLNINITMGDGINMNGTNAIPSMTQTTLTDTQILDRLRVIVKGKRGLMFERLDKCSLYNIQQSFDQDINITDSKTD